MSIAAIKLGVAAAGIITEFKRQKLHQEYSSRNNGMSRSPNIPPQVDAFRLTEEGMKDIGACREVGKYDVKKISKLVIFRLASTNTPKASSSGRWSLFRPMLPFL